MEINYM